MNNSGLIFKWLKSENASSKETKALANKIRAYLGMMHKEYRKMLSYGREKTKILERLMSSNEWDKIDFSKIPSKAGLVYRNAFARRDIIAKKYETFAKDKTTKVNADTLYPYEIVGEAIKYLPNSYWGGGRITADDTQRAMLDKYWENQKDVLNGKPFNAICVCDTSGSMRGNDKMAPINVAIGLSMYCAERAGGAFKNHYISFSSRPQMIKIEGTDFIDKVYRIYKTNLCEDTNLEATFKLLKSVALKSNPEDIPEQIIVISDMEVNYMSYEGWNKEQLVTGMEAIRMDWERSGLKFPKLVYWNVNARNNNFLDLGPNVSYVSGASPSFFEMLLTGKTGWDLMIETICAERYQAITA